MRFHHLPAVFPLLDQIGQTPTSLGSASGYLSGHDYEPSTYSTQLAPWRHDHRLPASALATSVRYADNAGKKPTSDASTTRPGISTNSCQSNSKRLSAIPVRS